MAQNDPSISDDTIIRLPAMQLIAMRSEQPCLRDQLAMAAPIPLQLYESDESFAINAGQRYRWADAMLEARKPK